MDFPAVEEMLRHWAVEPPADVLIAQFLGFKAPPVPPRPGDPKPAEANAVGDALTAEQVEKILGMFPGGAIRA
jgi:hypothetical protein